MSDIAVFAVSERGAKLAREIGLKLGGKVYVLEKYCKEGCIPFEKLSDIVEELFPKMKALVFVMAHGIAARVTGHLLLSKHTDPAIVVSDDCGRFIISSAGGHEGGANRLACEIASISGGTPVVTTATEADKRYVLGIGTRKDASKNDIVNAIKNACADAGITADEIRIIASAWIKQNEKGLLGAAEELGINIRFIPEFLYKAYMDKTEPTAAAKHFDIPAVAEPSAIIAAQHPVTVLKAKAYNSVMIAITKDTLIWED